MQSSRSAARPRARKPTAMPTWTRPPDMVALPKTITSPTVAAIFAGYEKREAAEPRRGHLGASVIGKPCERQLWYAFRWAYQEQFEGRMLRLFQRGHREEDWFAADLRSTGAQVHSVDPRTGQQFRFSAVGGHVGGSMDGCALGLIEAPKTWHVAAGSLHGMVLASHRFVSGRWLAFCFTAAGCWACGSDGTKPAQMDHLSGLSVVARAT